MDSAFDQALDRGIERFNRGEYWEAHEAWESVWLDERSERRPFLQGLIQLAAAWYHIGRQNWRGAVRLFDAALARLAPYPDDYCGVARKVAIALAVEAREALARGELPKSSSTENELRRSSELGRDFRKSEK